MIFRKKQAERRRSALRGVNLGGWLVLEKFITPSLFEGVTASDEYTLCKINGAGLQSKVREHHNNFVTRKDFEWLKQHGIEAVRLPVGYWTYGDEPPYHGTIAYVDKAFQWAAETGLFILLDMHAAPGSQNDWDHSGQAGSFAWHKDEKNVIKTLAVMSKLAKRYSRHPQLLGIELLNEPKWSIPRSVLLRYYKAAYSLIRAECGPNVWIVFSDSFRPRRWKHKLRGKGYNRMLMDTHQYQVFSSKDKKLNIAGHVQKTLFRVPKKLARMRKFHSIIIGEWSLALDQISLAGLDAIQTDAAYRAYAAAQILAYSPYSAWFYWTYRTEGGGPWSFRDSTEKGWLPDFVKMTSKLT